MPRPEHLMKRIKAYFSRIVLCQLLGMMLSSALVQVGCLSFGFPIFQPENVGELILSRNSLVFSDAIQVTPDLSRGMTNMSGRAFYREQLKLWDNRRSVKASFNSSFVLNINPRTSPGGEGLAFILAANTTLPNNSAGQWLGIVNQSSIGLSDVIAVEFDTRKSYPDDIDDNHVGVDVKSIYSIQQQPLGAHGVNLSSGTDITATVIFDAESGKLTVLVSTLLMLTVDLDLSKLLPEDVFVGFSASTGVYTQLNSIRSWNFSSWEVNIEKNPNLIWLWILIPIIVLGGIAAVAAICYMKRKRRKEQGLDEDLQIELQIKSSSNAPHKFRLKELVSATENFNSSNKLGKGGFGTVYKGTLMNGKDIAVKRISKDSRHGIQDFLAEITTMGNLNHKNLVKLIGWCYEKALLFLVYEFMPNGSLDKFVFSGNIPSSAQDSPLSWERRHSIICGVARALDYLHNGCDKRILHRDIKPSNVLLDSEFNSRLGDFGLARTIQISDKTHHSTKGIAGTPGYMAPESIHTQKAAVETDVYAFGVLMLEVVCGRKPGLQNRANNNDNSTVEWVWELYSRESVTEAVDTRLKGDFDMDEAKCLLGLGLACCHPNPYERPSMRSVLQVLTGEAAPPFVPYEKPLFVWPVTRPALEQDLNYQTSISQCTTITELATGR